jgi:hypothetical protein
MQNFASAQSKSKELTEAERMIDKLNNAEPTKKGQTQREAALEAGKAEAEKIMKSAKNDEKIDAAINIFRGFYFINVISRPKYCLKYEININKFAEVFKNKYKNEFNVMSEYEKKYKLTEKTRAEMFQMLDTAVATEIEMVANQYNVSSKVVCKDYQDNPTINANSIDFKTRAPDVYQLLNN